MDMVLAMVDTMDMVLDTAIMESVRLKLSPRLLPTPTFCIEDMDMEDTSAMVDIMDMV